MSAAKYMSAGWRKSAHFLPLILAISVLSWWVFENQNYYHFSHFEAGGYTHPKLNHLLKQVAAQRIDFDDPIWHAHTSYEAMYRGYFSYFGWFLANFGVHYDALSLAVHILFAGFLAVILFAVALVYPNEVFPWPGRSAGVLVFVSSPFLYMMLRSYAVHGGFLLLLLLVFVLVFRESQGGTGFAWPSTAICITLLFLIGHWGELTTESLLCLAIVCPVIASNYIVLHLVQQNEKLLVVIAKTLVALGLTGYALMLALDQFASYRDFRLGTKDGLVEYFQYFLGRIDNSRLDPSHNHSRFFSWFAGGLGWGQVLLLIFGSIRYKQIDTRKRFFIGSIVVSTLLYLLALFPSQVIFPEYLTPIILSTSFLVLLLMSRSRVMQIGIAVFLTLQFFLSGHAMKLRDYRPMNLNSNLFRMDHHEILEAVEQLFPGINNNTLGPVRHYLAAEKSKYYTQAQETLPFALRSRGAGRIRLSGGDVNRHDMGLYDYLWFSSWSSTVDLCEMLDNADYFSSFLFESQHFFVTRDRVNLQRLKAFGPDEFLEQCLRKSMVYSPLTMGRDRKWMDRQTVDLKLCLQKHSPGYLSGERHYHGQMHSLLAGEYFTVFRGQRLCVKKRRSRD